MHLSGPQQLWRTHPPDRRYTPRGGWLIVGVFSLVVALVASVTAPELAVAQPANDATENYPVDVVPIGINLNNPNPVTNATSGNGNPPSGPLPVVPYIVGGTPANPGEYPATVAVVANNGTVIQQFCAGTLIARDVVITAAHCGEVNGFNHDIEGLMVLVGRTNLQGFGGELIAVREMVIHPDYAGPGGYFYSDIALFFLERPATVASPASLATPGNEPNWSSNPAAVLQGWGKTAPGGSSTAILQQLEVNVLSDSDCLSAYPGSAVVYTAGKDLCAGQLNTGICNGDSGGPMYARNSQNQVVLAGIISRGHQICASRPGIMTRVMAHTGWITSTIANMNQPGPDPDPNPDPDPTPNPDPPVVVTTSRLWGESRWETAATLAQTAATSITAKSGSSALTVYLASGASFADALAASAIAGANNGVVLLTEKDKLPTATKTMLSHLAPGQLVVVGGTAVISNTTMAEAANAAGVAATRTWGGTRFDTAAQLSAQTFPQGTNEVFVALGTNFADAVAAGAPAGLAKAPVLLTYTNELPPETRAEIMRLAPNKIIILGGTKAISPTVASELAALATTQRLSGLTRFDTAAEVSKERFSGGSDTVYVATGMKFPDALAFGPLGTVANAPVLLLDPDGLSNTVINELRRLKPNQIVAIGGTKAVSDLVLLQLRNAL